MSKRATAKPGPALKLAVVSDGVYPYFKGGKEVRYHELLRRLAAAGVAVDVYTMAWRGRERTWTLEGVRFHAICRRWAMYVGPRRSVLQAAMFALASVRLLGADFDVLDVDHMPYLQVIPLRVVAWLKRKPMVLTWHESWGPKMWKEYLGRLGAPAALLERVAARSADRLIVESDGAAAKLVAAGVTPDRVAMVPVGIDVDRIRSGKPRGKRYDILYVGRLVAHKHLDMLLDAMRILRVEGRRLTCAVIGTGPAEDQLRDMAQRLGLADDVLWAGNVEGHGEVFSWMKSARVLVLPSTREGTGLVVLEAMACGTQVVTFDHPENGARERIVPGVTGFLCPPEVPSLARTIQTALDAPLSRDQLIESADTSDWSLVAERLLSVYRSVQGAA